MRKRNMGWSLMGGPRAAKRLIVVSAGVLLALAVLAPGANAQDETVGNVEMVTATMVTGEYSELTVTWQYNHDSSGSVHDE